MQTTVNGMAREVADSLTLRELVLLLGAHPDAVAVAVNGEVVPRHQLAERPVEPGDRVEVIRAVGGG